LRGDTDGGGNLVSYTDITAQATSDTAISVFADTGVNSQVIIGSLSDRSIPFSAMEIFTEDGFTGNSLTRVVLEYLTVEIPAGLVWKPAIYMTTFDPIHISARRDVLITGAPLTYRMNSVFLSNPIQFSAFSIGYGFGYWVRFRRIAVNSTTVAIKNVRLISNTMRVYSDGFRENFGTYQTVKKIELFNNTSSSALNPATTQALYFTPTISVERTCSLLSPIAAAGDQYSTDTLQMPYDVDLSKDFYILLRYTLTPPALTIAASLRLFMSLNKTQPDRVYFDPLDAPPLIDGERIFQIQNFTLTSATDPGLIYETRFIFDVSEFDGGALRETGDHLAVMVGRTLPLTGIDFPGSIAIVSVTVVYTSWREGGGEASI
jgi:hypothetical protein